MIHVLTKQLYLFPLRVIAGQYVFSYLHAPMMLGSNGRERELKRVQGEKEREREREKERKRERQ